MTIDTRNPIVRSPHARSVLNCGTILPKCVLVDRCTSSKYMLHHVTVHGSSNSAFSSEAQ